jgi:chitin disaccharide deacetylase
MTEPVIINADDYAMDEGVDAAILDLAERGVVTATSAMVLSPTWPKAAEASKDAPLSRGLHIDFTSPFAGETFPRQSITGMTIKSHAGALDRKSVKKAIERQLSLFEAHMNAAPDFVDGHQHAHQLPGVAESLVEVLSDRYGDGAGIGLRICVSRRWRGVKASIIGRTGAFRLAELAALAGHSTNSDFAGVYDFNEDADLGAFWRNWLTGLEGGAPLVMCHVATRGGGHDGGDPIRGARYREYDWLRGEAFAVLIQQLSKTPAHWPRA